jgi:hypothetical protein
MDFINTSTTADKSVAIIIRISFVNPWQSLQEFIRALVATAFSISLAFPDS